MSEPARQFQPQETHARPTAAPLRDWLAAMKEAAAQAEASGEAVQTRVQTRSAPVTPPQAANAPAADPDIAELMAENLMLKAQLRIETDRYNEIQSVLAQELRKLRAHIDEEMAELGEIRAERDLWMARAEALAQPLFQKR
jgi:predicted flap endonuclease-1-like 5' DNA nuclease